MPARVSQRINKKRTAAESSHLRRRRSTMAPSAEETPSLLVVGSSTVGPTPSFTTRRNRSSSMVAMLARKTITFAINWEERSLSFVDRYTPQPVEKVPGPTIEFRRDTSSVAGGAAATTAATPPPTHQRTTRRASRAARQQQQQETKSTTTAAATPSNNDSSSTSKSVVIVPPDDVAVAAEEQQQQQDQQSSSSSILVGPLPLPRSISKDDAMEEEEDDDDDNSEGDGGNVNASSSATVSVGGGDQDVVVAHGHPESRVSNRHHAREQPPAPLNLVRSRVRYDMELVPTVNPNFQGSVVYLPQSRKDWEDSLSELVAVCTSAVSRKQPLIGPDRKVLPVSPPLSREYIKDRIDIDDPLRGYQIRSAHGGWLQGYLLWTNFTTWTHFFKWDSLHEQSGIQSDSDKPDSLQDNDGSFAKELQALPREGDPSETGIVFPNVAEIALVGGLRCGSTLLRMALEEIRKYPQYQYIALQATDGSKKFYEHFGFKRVGAVCRYGTTVTVNGMKSQSVEMPTLETPVSGYRHWTHANEAPESLTLHGGPSYMMVLKLTDDIPKTNLLEYIEPFIVDDKPVVKPLGSPSTPAPRTGNPRGRPRKLHPVTGKRAFHADIHPGSTPTCSIINASKRRRISASVTDENMAPPSSLTPKGKPAKVTPRIAKKISSSRSSSSSISPPPSAPSLGSGGGSGKSRPVADPTKKVQKVDRTQLCKQKVKSYPRDRPHYYNKVVQPLSGSPDYYFVLHYSETRQELTLVPMKATGVLSGKRQGRPRFQCLVQETSANWLTSQPCDNFTPVPAFMVMKTPIVAQEAWDVLGADA